MQTVELAHRDWAGTLQSFREMHRTWLVSLEVMGSDIGAQPEAHDMPLAGITAESTGRRETISVFLERSPEQHLAHIIRDPTRVHTAGNSVRLHAEAQKSRRLTRKLVD